MNVQTDDACPHCRVSIAPEATVCPHCRRDVLFDLVVAQAIAEPRQRYRVAREVAALGIVAFSTINDALGTSGSTVCTSARRAHVRLIATSLANHGVQTRQNVTSPASTAAARPTPRKTTHTLVAGIALICVAAGGVASFTLLRPAEQTSVDEPAAVQAVQPSTQTIAELALTSTVALRCAQSVGSGFFVADHMVLTNAHVLCDGPSVDVVFRDGSVVKGQVLRRDEGLDLATVRVDTATAPALPLGDSGLLVVRDSVVVVGSPMGMEATVTEGGISNVERHAFGIAYLQTDAAINPGNSGGPMLDRNGTVVGVVTLKHQGAEGLSLALPINYAYRNPEPLVVHGSGLASQEFEARAARASAAGIEADRELAANLHKPALMGAAIEPGGRSLMASVVWVARRAEPNETLRFRIERQGASGCDIQGDIIDVVELPPDGPQTRLLGRSAKVAERGMKSFAASVIASTGGCAVAANARGSITLIGGFEGFNQKTF